MGVRIDDTDKFTYNHSDSYPEGLGDSIVNDIRRMVDKDPDLLNARQLARDLTLVNQGDVPTEEDKVRLRKYSDVSVGSQTLNDWYCLIRNTQGDFATTLESGKMLNSNEFMLDSLFCEWAYVVNFDANTFEVYKGFQRTRHQNGRYANEESQPSHRNVQYYPCALVAEFPLGNIPENWMHVLSDREEEEDVLPAKDEFLARIVAKYEKFAPNAMKVYRLLDPEIGHLDHVAFRTFDRGPVTLSDLESWLFARGYQITGTYYFATKHVWARSYSNHNASVPRVFLSELSVSMETPEVQRVIDRLVSEVRINVGTNLDFPWCVNPWPQISLREHDILSSESGDYAAWVAVNGLAPNHLTVNVEERIDVINESLKDKGFSISHAGGDVKGGPKFKFEQGSTLADTQTYETSDGHTLIVASAYCEYAKRWDGFDAFIQESANKIFESTDLRPVQRTLAIIKPDAMKRGLSNKLLTMLISEGLEIVQGIRIHMSKYEAETLYEPHNLRDFFDGLVEFMRSGESMVLEIQGQDCARRLREVVARARERYGMSQRENVIHGSDSTEAGERELAIFFPHDVL